MKSLFFLLLFFSLSYSLLPDFITCKVFSSDFSARYYGSSDNTQIFAFFLPVSFSVELSISTNQNNFLLNLRIPGTYNTLKSHTTMVRGSTFSDMIKISDDGNEITVSLKPAKYKFTYSIDENRAFKTYDLKFILDDAEFLFSLNFLLSTIVDANFDSHLDEYLLNKGFKLTN